MKIVILMLFLLVGCTLYSPTTIENNEIIDNVNIAENASEDKLAGIQITLNGQVMQGYLFDNKLAYEFLEYLPLTLTMQKNNEGEYIGNFNEAAFDYAENTSLTNENGEFGIGTNSNTLALFYDERLASSTDNDIQKLGKITSDYSVLHDYDNEIIVTFSIIYDEENKMTLGNPMNYVEIIRDQILERIITDEMSDYEKIKTIYRYIAQTSNWEDPVPYDTWIIKGGANQPSASFLQRKASSILQYGYGYCDDFAAAIAVLLDGAGIDVRYIPGLAYSSGRLMDHAWNLVKLEDQWYHLDCTYEDSISINGIMSYRYFLKGNNDLPTSHVWGTDLINGGYLTALQNEQILKFYDVEVSDTSYEQTSPEAFSELERVDKNTLLPELQEERNQFVANNGEIDPFLYDATAPVFGDMGYNR